MESLVPLSWKQLLNFTFQKVILWQFTRFVFISVNRVTNQCYLLLFFKGLKSYITLFPQSKMWRSISKALTIQQHYSVWRKDESHPSMLLGFGRRRSDTELGAGLRSQVKWRNFFKSSRICFESHGSRVRAAEGNTELDYIAKAHISM